MQVCDLEPDPDESSDELLMPYIPDLDESSEEEHVYKMPTPPKVEELARQAAETLEIMKSMYLHNHNERQLSSKQDFFAKLSAGRVCPHSRPIPVISVNDTTYQQFLDCHVFNGGYPVIIRGIPEKEGWPAASKWSSEEKLMSHYGHLQLKVFDIRPVSGMGKPYELRLPLFYFKQYCDTNTADSPFYGFEYDFSDYRAALLEDYEVPSFFSDDFYNTNDYIRKFYPNNKHLIVGGQRTGTNLHFDPKGTCAWNTCLLGRKKWALFPPGTDQEYMNNIHSKTCQSGTAPGGPPAYWWMDDAPKIGNVGMIEFIQEPGDTVFVPSGWWHTVVNLEFNFCITQNLLIPQLLPSAWPQLKQDWPKFSRFVERNYSEVLTSNGVEVVSSEDYDDENIEEEIEFYSVHRQ